MATSLSIRFDVWVAALGSGYAPHSQFVKWADQMIERDAHQPRDPARAVDDFEHDLAVLKPLLDVRDPSVKGRAHYLLGLNEPLKRSITSRWLRDRSAWSSSDGIVKVTPAIAPAIAAHRLAARPYSLSALQR